MRIMEVYSLLLQSATHLQIQTQVDQRINCVLILQMPRPPYWR